MWDVQVQPKTKSVTLKLFTAEGAGWGLQGEAAARVAAATVMKVDERMLVVVVGCRWVLWVVGIAVDVVVSFVGVGVDVVVSEECSVLLGNGHNI
jgi:hypothetical protein